jgi:hypothetical protein
MSNKLGLFDLFTFLLPGATFLTVSYYLAFAFSPHWIPNIQVTEAIGAFPFLFFSYLVGHLLSMVGRKLESKFGLKKAWTIFLLQPKRLNQFDILCQKQFKYSYLNL